MDSVSKYQNTDKRNALKFRVQLPRPRIKTRDTLLSPEFRYQVLEYRQEKLCYALELVTTFWNTDKRNPVMSLVQLPRHRIQTRETQPSSESSYHVLEHRQEKPSQVQSQVTTSYNTDKRNPAKFRVQLPRPRTQTRETQPRSEFSYHVLEYRQEKPCYVLSSVTTSQTTDKRKPAKFRVQLPRFRIQTRETLLCPQFCYHVLDYRQ